MKLILTLAKLFALTKLSLAFPTNLIDHVLAEPEILARAQHVARAGGPENGDAPALPETFHGASQLIDVTGEHTWQAPGPNDLRGPCPGLNALANHGYLPRSGYATLAEFQSACVDVLGFGPLLTAIAALIGAVFDGSGTAWSIGGKPSTAVVGLNGLLGAGNGISNSHNKYEGDASPTRPDLYQYGNDYKLVVSQFQDLVNIAEAAGTDNYNVPILTQFNQHRVEQQIASNPYFFSGPFTGVFLRNAVYPVIYRCMANHTEEAPYGILNLETLKGFFGVSGESGSFTWTEGHERIPNNWYRRDPDQPWEIPYAVLDILYGAAKYPRGLSLGGNLGKVNTFTGVDLGSVTGGVLNAQNILEGNNLICLALQAATQSQPDVIAGAFASLLSAVGQLGTKLACPQISNLNMAQLEHFPGYKGP